MPLEQSDTFRRYRAPQGDGQALIDPAWAALPAVIQRNRRLVDNADCDLHGQSIASLAVRARRNLLEQAIAYTRGYRDVSVTPPELRENPALPIVLSGHQPQLYHPGVWYKNFVLGSLAKRVQGVGIHLVIDSDLCRGVSLRMPAGSLGQPRLENVAFDEPSAEVPFEERIIRDAATFRSFADRAATTIAPFVDDPCLRSLWPHVLDRSRVHSNLGLCLAQGRHALEGEWQNETLELPQSAVCQLPEFSWFVAYLLTELPRFQIAHNSALADYRQAHHLRNRAHPVPDLATKAGWLEAPLWMWTADDPRRRPLYARQKGRQIEITDRNERTFAVSLTRDGVAGGGVDQLMELAKRGIKIRTRALGTTLFARLLLSDIFLHGIGGAKYDQVTDLIARRFFGFDLPEFATVSATLRLPIDRPSSQAAEIPLSHTLRELRYHPERFLGSNGSSLGADSTAVSEIVATKRRWVALPKSPENAHERHLAISSANQALQPYVEAHRARVERKLEESDDRVRAAAILDSREYAFCLFPRRQIERLLVTLDSDFIEVTGR